MLAEDALAACCDHLSDTESNFQQLKRKPLVLTLDVNMRELVGVHVQQRDENNRAFSVWAKEKVSYSKSDDICGAEVPSLLGQKEVRHHQHVSHTKNRPTRRFRKVVNFWKRN